MRNATEPTYERPNRRRQRRGWGRRSRRASSYGRELVYVRATQSISEETQLFSVIATEEFGDRTSIISRTKLWYARNAKNLRARNTARLPTRRPTRALKIRLCRFVKLIRLISLLPSFLHSMKVPAARRLWTAAGAVPIVVAWA